MEQTALEWLYDQIENKGKCIYEVIDQARILDKEQHKKTWSEGMFCETGDIQAFEQYYNKNFKSE